MPNPTMPVDFKTPSILPTLRDLLFEKKKEKEKNNEKRKTRGPLGCKPRPRFACYTAGTASFANLVEIN